MRKSIIGHDHHPIRCLRIPPLLETESPSFIWGPGGE
jgi:hypothetical protein